MEKRHFDLLLNYPCLPPSLRCVRERRMKKSLERERRKRRRRMEMKRRWRRWRMWSSIKHFNSTIVMCVPSCFPFLFLQRNACGKARTNTNTCRFTKEKAVPHMAKKHRSVILSCVTPPLQRQPCRCTGLVLMFFPYYPSPFVTALDKDALSSQDYKLKPNRRPLCIRSITIITLTLLVRPPCHHGRVMSTEARASVTHFG